MKDTLRQPAHLVNHKFQSYTLYNIIILEYGANDTNTYQDRVY